jgi:hypothetical protein
MGDGSLKKVLSNSVPKTSDSFVQDESRIETRDHQDHPTTSVMRVELKQEITKIILQQVYQDVQ